MDTMKTTDTRGLDFGARLAVLFGPPKYDDPDDKDRLKNEMWAHLGQIWPLHEEELYVFQPRDLRYVILGKRKPSAQDGQSRNWTFFFQDIDPGMGEQRFHNEGTIYNCIEDDSEYSLHPATLIERSTTKIRFFNEHGSIPRLNQRGTETVFDSYADSLGLLRHKSLCDRKKTYQASFAALDMKVYSLFESLIQLVHSRPQDTSQQEEVKNCLKDRNIQYLLGDELHRYWSELPDDKFGLDESDLQADDETAIFMVKNLISKLIPEDDPAALTNSHDDYYESLLQNVLPKVWSAYTLTHPSYSAFRHVLGWNRQENDFDTATGKQIFRLNQVARKIIGYFGQVAFPGTSKTLFQQYESKWQVFENIDNL